MTIRITCFYCGSSIKIREQNLDDTGDLLLQIDTCETCMNTHNKDEYENGYKDGLEQGYNEGLIAGQN